MITGKKIKMKIKKTKKDKEVRVKIVYISLRKNTVSFNIFLIVVFCRRVDLTVKSCKLIVAFNVAMMLSEKF